MGFLNALPIPNFANYESEIRGLTVSAQTLAKNKGKTAMNKPGITEFWRWQGGRMLRSVHFLTFENAVESSVWAPGPGSFSCRQTHDHITMCVVLVGRTQLWHIQWEAKSPAGAGRERGMVGGPHWRRVHVRHKQAHTEQPWPKLGAEGRHAPKPTSL